MARILIVYGTTEGQTRKVAAHLATVAREVGADVEMYDATSLPPSLTVGPFTGVFVAASLHAGHHQAAIAHFIRSNLHALNAANATFLSISLSAAGDEKDRDEAWTCAKQFLSDTGWHPTYTHIVAGALRYTQYDFFRRWIMKRIAKEKGAPTDTSRDVEYTDWVALDGYVKELISAPARAPRPVSARDAKH